MEVIVGILIGAVVVMGAVLLLRRTAGTRPRAIVMTGGGLESIRRVGELVVLKAHWSIPAIGRDHVLGDIGQRFLRWLWTENKSIMIFTFEIRFKYDLRDPASVEFSPSEAGILDVQLGPPSNDISLSDIRFFHTEKGQLLDWILPKAINIFRSDLDDATRQLLVEEARKNARAEAEKTASALIPEARASAEMTLSHLARAAGFADVRFTSRESRRPEEQPAPPRAGGS
ncbi:MAG: DUF4230 domain-containing protein [Planctomycetes bacterium]|nr:DUF4230 domain-containing protein [Planctomycetota bacterium]